MTPVANPRPQKKSACPTVDTPAMHPTTCTRVKAGPISDPCLPAALDTKINLQLNKDKQEPEEPPSFVRSASMTVKSSSPKVTTNHKAMTLQNYRKISEKGTTESQYESRTEDQGI